MADGQLKVRIDAEIEDLKAKMKEAAKVTEAAVTTISKTTEKAEKSFSLLNNTKFTFGQNYVKASKAIANEAAATSAILGGSTVKGANQAAFALTNLGRVAQDAPFGFIGIQNNLNPLLESFGRLKSETGSTGSALKALVSGLIGPAGLGIALSVVSAGILFYQQYQQKAKKATENAKKTNEDYAESLNQIARASLVGAKSATQEITTLSLLYKQYRNNELSLQQRKSAYDQLQKLYPAYFGNIKFEQEESAKTKDAYDRLTTSILATSRARAAADLITKNSQRQLENEQKLIDLGIAASKAKEKADKSLLASRGAGGELGQASATADLTAALKEQRDIQRQINNIVTDSVILRDKNLQLEKSVTSEIEKGGRLSGDIGGSLVKADKIKTQSDILKQLRLELLKVSESVDITFGEGNKQRVSAFAKAIDELLSIKGDKSVINNLKNQLLNIDPAKIKLAGKTVGVSLSTGISEGFEEAIPVISQKIGANLKIGLSDWDSYLNNELLPKIEGNFETFFNDILMNGKLSFDSLGKAILNTFVSIIASDAARQVSGLFKANTKAEFSTDKNKGGLLGGILGIGGSTGGGALLPIIGGIAAVAGIASLFKKRKVDPQPAFVTASNVSSSPVSNSGFDYGRVVFEISGVNLIGVLNRSGAKLQRFGP